MYIYILMYIYIHRGLGFKPINPILVNPGFHTAK